MNAMNCGGGALPNKYECIGSVFVDVDDGCQANSSGFTQRFLVSNKAKTKQFHEVALVNSVYKPALVDAQLDVHLGCSGIRPSISTERPAGYGRGVTAETVSQLCQQGQVSEAVEALALLAHSDPVIRIPHHLLYAVLQKCSRKKDLVLGRRVHAVCVKVGYESDTFLCNHLLRMYSSHARLQEAMDVFTLVAKPDAFTWSAIISAHVHHGQARQALQLYLEMRTSSVKPDGHVFVSALQACAREADLETGQQVHADVMASGVGLDLFISSCLVDMYAKCGSLEDAQRVFDGLPERDVVMWNAIISGYSQHGMGQDALQLYADMQQEGITAPDPVTYVCLLQACASVGISALEKGKQLHARIEERGLQADVVLANSLVNMYAKCGSLEDAQGVFDRLRQKNVVTWTSLIAGYSQQGLGQEALCLYCAMQEEGIAAPNPVTFVCLLQACASVGTPALEKGKQLHAQIVEQGLGADVAVANSLVNMYAKCGSLEDAQGAFDRLQEKNVVTWTALIAGYSQKGMGQEALSLYGEMQQEGIAAPDSVTFLCLLQACASVGISALDKGKQLHAQIGDEGLLTEDFVASSLVNMYAKCGSLEDAQDVFDTLGQKNVVTWNAIIAGYSQQGRGQEALRLYSAMQQEGLIAPDSVTFVCLLQACASMGASVLENGKQLHAQIREQGLQGEVFVANSLVNMYAKCGSLEDAQRVFDGLSKKDVVTWNAMIAGYSQQGMGLKAIHLYSAMQEEGTAAPSGMTFVSLLQACADVAALHLGRQLHGEIEEQGLLLDVFVAISLINMYAKSGSMVDAQQVFDALPARDVVAWNALIAGYTRQGNSEVVFGLVHRMGEDGVQPDGITFVSVLTACSHAGLVSKGQEYFEDMRGRYGITPMAEHYSCMVDLLGRAGQLDEALMVAKTMPIPPDTTVWHMLLGACQKWRNVEVGGHAFNEAVKLDQKDPSAYVLMSNIYISAQMWKKAEEMQEIRKRVGAWKQPGESWWTDMDGLVHSFVVGDKKHRKIESMHAKMRQQACNMKSEGYVPLLDVCSGEITHDDKETQVGWQAT